MTDATPTTSDSEQTPREVYRVTYSDVNTDEFESTHRADTELEALRSALRSLYEADIDIENKGVPCPECGGGLRSGWGEMYIDKWLPMTCPHCAANVELHIEDSEVVEVYKRGR